GAVAARPGRARWRHKVRRADRPRVALAVARGARTETLRAALPSFADGPGSARHYAGPGAARGLALAAGPDPGAAAGHENGPVRRRSRLAGGHAGTAEGAAESPGRAPYRADANCRRRAELIARN